MIPSPPSSVFKRVFICSDIEWTSVTPPPLMVPENEKASSRYFFYMYTHSVGFQAFLDLMCIL